MAFVPLAAHESCLFEIDVVGTTIQRLRITNSTNRVAVVRLARRSDNLAARVFAAAGETKLVTAPLAVRLALALDAGELPDGWNLTTNLLPAAANETAVP